MGAWSTGSYAENVVFGSQGKTGVNQLFNPVKMDVFPDTSGKINK